MEKRKLISLRAVLLGYLVQTAVSCIVAAVLWFLLFFLCIDSGWLLPANRAARVSNEAVQNILPYRTAKHLTRLSWTPCAGMCCLMQRGIRCLPPTWTVPICKKQCGSGRGIFAGRLDTNSIICARDCRTGRFVCCNLTTQCPMQTQLCAIFCRMCRRCT